MALYLAQHLPSASGTHPLFVERDLQRYAPTKLSSLDVRAVPLIREIAYDGYYRNLDIFVGATNQGKKLATALSAAPFTTLTRPLIPITPPRVSFFLSASMTKDQESAFAQKINEKGGGCITTRAGNATRFILLNPTDEVVDRILPSCDNRRQHDPSEIPIHAWPTFRFVQRAISEFLATNIYPAFRDEDSLRTDADLHASFESLALEATPTVAVPRKKAKLSTEGPGGEEDGDEEMDDGHEEEPELAHTTCRQAVLVAKPSTFGGDFNWGPPSCVPQNLPGFVFPYFDQMVIGDRETLRNLILDFFFRNLGESREDVEAQYKVVRKMIDFLVQHKVGQALSHLGMGVRLAMQSQTRLFAVVEDGQYAGFTLLGAGFRLFLHNEWKSPRAALELATDVSHLTTHTVVLDRVCKRLSGLRLRDGSPPVAVNAKSILGGAHLVELILARKVEGDEMRTLSGEIARLSFPRTYRAVNIDNVLWAIRQMTIDVDKELPRDAAMYIPMSLQSLSSKVFRTLACFGPEAPSFLHVTGLEYSLARGKKLPSGEVSLVGGDTPERISLKIKSLAAAYSDWNSLVNSKKIRINVKERAANHSCYVFRDVATKQLWEELCLCVNPQIEEPAEKDTGTSKKRKIGEVDRSAPKTDFAGLMSLF